MIRYRTNGEVEAALQKFPIYTQYRDRRQSSSWHVQTGIEIHILDEGCEDFWLDQKRIPQMSRDVLILSGDTPHREECSPGETIRRTVICFNPSKWTGEQPMEMSLLPCFLHVRALNYPKLDALCRALHAELLLQREGWQVMAKGLFLQLCGLLLRERKPGPVTPGQSALDLASRCRDFILSNLEERLDGASLARRFGVSRSHLCRAFGAATGSGLQSFIRESRLERAAHLLLENPELEVLEVALRTGFQSHPHFTRCFLRRFGKTPSAYRNPVDPA